MPADYYKVIHIAGLILLSLALGGMLLAPEPESKNPEAKRSKATTIMHGVALLAILVAGFGLVARGGYGWPPWVIFKIGIWLLLGALPVLIRRDLVPRAAGWIIAFVAAGGAAYLGLIKPGS